MANKSRADIRRSVHSRIRKKVRGTAERPRLAVYRSINHIYAQIIDDVSGKTLASASTLEKPLKGKTGGNIDAATAVGKAIAERARGAGVSEVVFDRGGYVYHGRVKALIDASREAGLNQNGGGSSSEPAAKKAEEADKPVETKQKKAEKAAPDKKAKAADPEKPATNKAEESGSEKAAASEEE